MTATLADARMIDSAELDARKLRKRGQKLEQKRRERERRAATKLARDIAEAERARLEAISTEHRDEFLAPAVLRGAIMSGEIMLRGPMVRIVAGRPMIGPEFPFAPARSRRAACALRLDWQEVGGGINVPAVDYERAGGHGSGQGACVAMVEQVTTRKRLDDALASLGLLAPAISRTVLDCIPIPVWAVEENARRAAKGLDAMTPDGAVAAISGGLRRLADFYWPPVDNHLTRAT